MHAVAWPQGPAHIRYSVVLTIQGRLLVCACTKVSRRGKRKFKPSQNNTCIFETARGFKLDIPSIGGHRPSVLEQSSEVLRPLLFELGLLFCAASTRVLCLTSSVSSSRPPVVHRQHDGVPRAARALLARQRAVHDLAFHGACYQHHVRRGPGHPPALRDGRRSRLADGACHGQERRRAPAEQRAAGRGWLVARKAAAARRAGARACRCEARGRRAEEGETRETSLGERLERQRRGGVTSLRGWEFW